MSNLSIERLKDFGRDPLNNFLTRSEMMEIVKELIAIRELKGDQVPVDTCWVSLTEAECEQWKTVSIEANKKVAAFGDENRKLRAEIAKIKG